MKLLKRDNYKGSITIEGVRSGTDKLEAAKDALRFFKELEKSYSAIDRSNRLTSGLT